MASYSPLSGSLHDAGDAVAVTVDNGERAVFGRTVHKDVFYVVVGLRDNALNRVLQYRFGIVGHGDDAEFRGGGYAFLPVTLL